MNKVIVTNSRSPTENEELQDLDVRRLNAKIQHEDISEEALIHYGVKGMRWGVRNEKKYSSNILRKRQVDRQVANAAWKDAIKGMSKIKSMGIYFLLGPKWGAQAINAMRAKKADPKNIVKKETKKLRKKIAQDFTKRVEAELAAHEAQFRAKNGPNRSIKNLFSKEGRAKNSKLVDEYTKTLTARMENMFNEVAANNLAGTNYTINASSGFNDVMPSFTLTPTDSIQHAATSPKRKSWTLTLEWNDAGFLKSVNFPKDFFEVSDDELSFLNNESKDEGTGGNLAHYGVKGMRWGVRKADYQTRVNRARGYRARRTLSDKDLRTAINRMQLEKQYKKLVMEDLSAGQAFIADMLPKVGGAALMAAAGSLGAKLAKEYVKNKFGG